MSRFATAITLGAMLCAPSLFSQTIHGAGATFPAPLYTKWAAAFQQANPGMNVVYEAIGSGGGIKKILEGSVNFGATDTPMSDAEKAKAQGTLLHLPMTMGAVAVAFNVPGVQQLDLTPELLSGIFMGQISHWDDARIVAINGGAGLPHLAITVAYRSDASGTTAIYTDYLSKVSADWKAQIGAGKSVKFPVGMASKGNEGVSQVVKDTPGAIGYMELAFAKNNQLGLGRIQNQAGQFVAPSPEGVSAAAASVNVPENLCASLTNGTGAQDYPISTFSYLVVYQQQKDAVEGKALVSYLKWAVREGQTMAADLHYAPLPTPWVSAVESAINSIQ